MLRKSPGRLVSLYAFMLAFTVFFIFWSMPAVRADMRTLEIVYIYDNPCASCDSEGEFLAFLDESIGEHRSSISINVKMINAFTVSSSVVDALYQTYEVPQGDQNLPMVLIGSSYLSGETAIQEQFTKVFLAERDRATADTSKQSTVHYFYVPSCSACDDVSSFFETLEESYVLDHSVPEVRTNLVINRYDASDPAVRAALHELFKRYEVPEQKRQVPIVFLTETYLSGFQTIQEALADAIQAGQGMGAIELGLPETGASDTVIRPASQNEGLDTVYFLYSEYCETCKEAKAFLEQVRQQAPIEIILYDIHQDKASVEVLMNRYGLNNVSVPIIIFQDEIWQGFNPVIAKELTERFGIGGYEIPFLLENIDRLPLLLSTIIIGLMDGFNPCSLWALLFIMSMILRFRSRRLILLLGLVYILVISMLYGLFIIGMFGVVSYILDHLWLRLVFFVLAFSFAAANIASFFSKGDPFISISAQNKKRFVQRIRSKLYTRAGVSGMLGAVIGLALLASVIELPCTAGFPMIWNAAMAEHQVNSITYAAHLLLYLLMYVMIELIVVVFMVATLSQLYMNAMAGRTLKLMSGALMAYLAVLLLVGYSYLSNTGLLIGGSVIVLLLSFALAYLPCIRKRVRP